MENQGLEQIPIYKPHKRKKWLIVLFIVIALGIITGAAYILMCPPEEKAEQIPSETEQENKTINWNFSQNRIFGIQIKYPEELNVSTFQDENKQCFNIDFPTQSKISYCMGPYDTPTGESSSIKIDGKNYTIWQKENKYEISINEDEEIIFIDENNDYSLFEEILATLEFTKDETFGWKIYKNTDLGFEIKYPNDLEMSEYYTSENLSISVPGFENIKVESDKSIFKREETGKAGVVKILSVDQSIDDLLIIFRDQIQNEEKFVNEYNVSMILFNSELEYYLVDKNSKTIILIIENRSENLETNKILSSFNFIE